MSYRVLPVLRVRSRLTTCPSLPWLYIVGCLLILAGVATPLWRWSTPAKAEAAVAPINASPWRLQNIEAIRVGQRVVTDAANRTETLPTAVDPATWRRVTIVGAREMASGKEDRIVVQTIVPPTWLEFFDAHVGAVVPYPLDLVEMGIPEELDGEITDIAPCPAILEGPGRVVLTTVHHLSHDVWQLELTAEDGTSEQLKSTGFHPFYSVDRDDYVQVHGLRSGERLQGSQGLVTLQAKKPIAGYHEVYNLTVEEEHVYRVGGLGTLVHNQSCADYIALGVEKGGGLLSAERKGYAGYSRWVTRHNVVNGTVDEYIQGFREATTNAKGILFSLDNFTVGAAVRDGSFVSATKSNVTKWEFYQILSKKSLRDKTSFIFGGREMGWDELLENKHLMEGTFRTDTGKFDETSWKLFWKLIGQE